VRGLAEQMLRAAKLGQGARRHRRQPRPLRGGGGLDQIVVSFVEAASPDAQSTPRVQAAGAQVLGQQGVELRRERFIPARQVRIERTVVHDHRLQGQQRAHRRARIARVAGAIRQRARCDHGQVVALQAQPGECAGSFVPLAPRRPDRSLGDEVPCVAPLRVGTRAGLVQALRGVFSNDAVHVVPRRIGSLAVQHAHQ
jgi:hypothetical protein